ncbi:response regulator [Phormidium tenue FACHB-886]|nr:response regulator [Phormidium tenue FACHB-886]
MEYSSGYCILVVDDNLDNLMFMQCFLEAKGYNVAIAQNGTAALAQVAASPPDLILLDLMMPDMSGLEVTKRIRQHDDCSDIPILLVTAYNELLLEQELPREIQGVIPKPVDIEQLLEAVQAHCRKKPLLSD